MKRQQIWKCLGFGFNNSIQISHLITSFLLVLILSSSESESSQIDSPNNGLKIISKPVPVPVSAPLIHKCCRDGQEYNLHSDECVPLGTVFGSAVSLADILKVPRNLILHMFETPAQWSTTSTLSKDLPDYQFRLKPFFPNESSTCSEGSFIVEMKIERSLSSSKVKSSARPLLTDTGLIKYRHEYYTKSEFCIGGITNSKITVRLCNPTCTGDTPCIRKCCDLNQVWNQMRGQGKQGCVSAGKKLWSPFWRLPINISAQVQLLEEAKFEFLKHQIQPHYQIAHPRRWCSKDNGPIIIRSSASRSKFRVSMSGDVVQSLSRYSWKTKAENPQHYCLDGIINPKDALPQLPPNSNSKTGRGNPKRVGRMETEYSGNNKLDSMIFDCSPLPKDEDYSKNYMYGGLFMIAILFHFLTMVVHLLLRRKMLLNVHDWTLFAYVTSLFFMYIFMAFLHLASSRLTHDVDANPNWFCDFIGIGLNFFFVSTFSWMTMFNWDIFRTVKGLNACEDSKGRRRFFLYFTFAMGVPTVIVVVAMALQMIYGEDYGTNVIVPDFGHTTWCNLDPEYAQLAYGYGPAGVLLGMNVIIFTWAMCTMYGKMKVFQETSQSSTSARQIQSLKLFAKLLMVMGIPWIFEVISWAADGPMAPTTSWYWIIFDIINVLQAPVIFYIFVCNRNTLNLLQQKYPNSTFLQRLKKSSDQSNAHALSHADCRTWVTRVEICNTNENAK